MIRYLHNFITTFLISLLLSSCATVTQPEPEDEPQASVEPAGWTEQVVKRQQINSWELRGRLGVQTRDNGGSMDIIWKQSAGDFSIRLIAPMAAGSYLIQGEQEVANIRYPDGNRENIDNVDDIFLSTLEVDLPSTAIKDWVRGLPAKELAVDEITWNEFGLIDRIKQSGWNVEMTKYAGARVLLPHAIYISREDDPDLDIRLLLRQWMLDDSTPAR